MKADEDLQETIRRRNMRSKKNDLQQDEDHAQQDVQQQGQDLPVPDDGEDIVSEGDYEGVAGMEETSDEEMTGRDPAAIQDTSDAMQRTDPPTIDGEPETKRQRLQWLETVIDNVLGGLDEDG